MSTIRCTQNLPLPKMILKLTYQYQFYMDKLCNAQHAANLINKYLVKTHHDWLGAEWLNSCSRCCEFESEYCTYTRGTIFTLICCKIAHC